MIATLIHDNDENKIFNFLLRNTDSFTPSLSSRVNIFEYAIKLASNATNIFLIIDGVDIGHAAVYINTESNAFLSSFCIDCSYQCTGFGTILMSEVLKTCKEHRALRINLEVSLLTETAIKFYKKHNFIVIHNQNGTLFMRKELLTAVSQSTKTTPTE